MLNRVHLINRWTLFHINARAEQPKCIIKWIIPLLKLHICKKKHRNVVYTNPSATLLKASVASRVNHCGSRAAFAVILRVIISDIFIWINVTVAASLSLIVATQQGVNVKPVHESFYICCKKPASVWKVTPGRRRRKSDVFNVCCSSEEEDRRLGQMRLFTL